MSVNPSARAPRLGWSFKPWWLIGVAAACVAILVRVSAQTNDEPATMLLHAGRVFDSEMGRFLPAQDILVRGGTIEAVGEKLPVPSSAREIDLRMYTVLPGLIDAHTHLLYLESPRQNITTELLKALTLEGTPLRALRGAARARTFLEAGITTVRDLGNAGRFGDVALRIAINEGSVVGPRMYVSGPGLSSEGGQVPGLQQSYRAIAEEEYRVVRSPSDGVAAVRENLTYGADLIKIYSDSAPNRAVLTVEEMRAIVTAAHLQGIKVAAHAMTRDSVARAVEAGVDSIEHGYAIDDVTLRLMKDRGIVLVPTDADRVTVARLLEGQGVGQAETDGFLAATADRLRRAIAAGVTIAAGSDMYIDLDMPQGEAARRVLLAYREAGMEPVAILQAATVNAARLIGQPRLGVVRAGAFADLIAVEGGPAADFTAMERVRFVMRNGVVHHGQR